MKALLALLLFTTPAFAGTVITVSVGDVSETWTLSDTDQQKFEAWVQFSYRCPQPPPPPVLTQSMQGLQPPAPIHAPRVTVAQNCTSPLTLAESEAEWAKATLQGTFDNVTRFQNTVAAAAAVGATTPIGFSIGTTKK